MMLFLIIFFASVFFTLVESIALIVIAKKYRWPKRSWEYVVHPFTGADNRISFTKIFDLILVAGYAWKGVNFMPTGVAVTLIGSAHGTKVLLAVLQANAAPKQTTTITQPADMSTTPPTPAVTTTKTETTDPAAPLPHVSGEG